jgi:hypothetical protein
MYVNAMRAAYADLGEDWLRRQLAELNRRQMQWGRHFRVDVAAILANAARCARATTAGAHSREVCDPPVAELSEPDDAIVHSSCRVVTPALRGERLLARNFKPCSPSDWLAVIDDDTEVVVPDSGGAPHALAIAKAVSILQARDYLVGRALRLLEPISATQGSWRLVTVDMGAAAACRGCEFLMCFALEAGARETAYAEVAFLLAGQEIGAPLFIASVQQLTRHGVHQAGRSSTAFVNPSTSSPRCADSSASHFRRR